jgi:hypothetical protein
MSGRTNYNEPLARYRALPPLPMETWVQLFIDAAQRRLILDGIALAENKSLREPTAKSEY